MGMSPAERLKLMSLLAKVPGGELRLFFTSYGLGAAYAAPSKGYGRPERVSAAFAAADRRGDTDEVLKAAAQHFGLTSSDRSESMDQTESQAGFGSWLDDFDATAQQPSTTTESEPANTFPTPEHDGVGDEAELRRRAFEIWDESGEWPFAQVLQQRIEREGGRLDVELTARKLDRGVGYIEMNHKPRVVLRMAGLVRTRGAERYVSAFLTALRLAYVRYRDNDSDDQAKLSRADLETQLAMGPNLTQRVYGLLEGEWFLLEGGSSDPNQAWIRDISPNVRFFRDVETGDRYVRAANELVRPYVREPTDSAPSPGPTPAASPTPAVDRAIQIFNTVLVGGTAAIGTNSPVQITVVRGNVASLMSFLGEQGVEPADQDELKTAIAADAKDGDGTKPGRRVTAWLARVAASGGRVGEGTSAGLIAAAVARFLGWI